MPANELVPAGDLAGQAFIDRKASEDLRLVLEAEMQALKDQQNALDFAEAQDKRLEQHRRSMEELIIKQHRGLLESIEAMIDSRLGSTQTGDDSSQYLQLAQVAAEAAASAASAAAAVAVRDALPATPPASSPQRQPAPPATESCPMLPLSDSWLADKDGQTLPGEIPATKADSLTVPAPDLNTVGKSVPADGIETLPDMARRIKAGANPAELDGAFEWAKGQLKEEKHWVYPRYMHLDNLRAALHTNVFTAFMSTMILLNACFIGMQADANVKRTLSVWESLTRGIVEDDSEPAWWVPVDIFFLVLFTVELTTRIIAEELDFFLGSDWKWNIFDAFLVVTALMEEALSTFDLTFLRTLRMLRTVRALRVVRVVRFFRELRVMLLAVWGSVMPVVWAFAFLAGMMFLVGVIFLQGVQGFVATETKASSVTDFRDCSAEGVDADSWKCMVLGLSKEYFRSVPMMLLSLFMAISGGMDWWEFGKPLFFIHWGYGMLFVIFIFFISFGVLNVITGIFVDGAVSITQADRDLRIQDEYAAQDDKIKSLKTIFHVFDPDHSGKVTFQEFTQQCQRREVQAFFGSLNLDVHEALMVFKLLDQNGDKELKLEEFVMGCMRIQGNARNIDIVTLMHENKLMMDGIGMMITSMFAKIESRLPTTCGSSSPPQMNGVCLS